MAETSDKEITGAWIIHHGRKLALDANGAAEFPAIDEASKAATLLTKLGQTNQVVIPEAEVRAIAIAGGLNPRYELTSLLGVLERKRLITRGNDSIELLGVTTRGSLRHAADMYQEAVPNSYEQASVSLAEMASVAPIRRVDVVEKIGDEHRLTKSDVNDFLNRAEEIGFVDREGEGDDKLLFNGNLFRRENASKSQRVLSSLNTTEQALVVELNDQISKKGCLSSSTVESVLGNKLLEKLIAAGMYDMNQVTNEQGIHVYITSPSAFHKFVDPLIDDCFDLAKSLVAALTYGMTARPSSQGRIDMLPRLLGNLIAGYEIGPATAIGEDYRVLEVNGVVKLRRNPQYPNRYHMRLLKREVGELALQVLTQGNASAQALADFPSAPMAGYVGPEESRTRIRKRQSLPSKRTTRDVLEAIRGGRAIP